MRRCLFFLDAFAFWQTGNGEEHAHNNKMRFMTSFPNPTSVAQFRRMLVVGGGVPIIPCPSQWADFLLARIQIHDMIN